MLHCDLSSGLHIMPCCGSFVTAVSLLLHLNANSSSIKRMRCSDGTGMRQCPRGVVFRVLIACNSIGLLSLISSLSLPVSLTQALGKIPSTAELHNTSSISVQMGRSHMRLYTRDDSGTNSEAHMADLAKSSESASVPRCGERISGLKRKVFHLVRPLLRNNS